MKRLDGRRPDQMRKIEVETDFVEYAEGSVLISAGKTRVLCNVSVEEGQPSWKVNKGLPGGWITAEYALLPRSTHTRVERETDGWSGRTQEIRRLIGRSLRAGFDLEKIGPRTCIVDCDVLQADGGTRTLSVTGGYLALALAFQRLIEAGELSSDVFLSPVAAVSVGMLDGGPVLDLCYREDAAADVDLNLVMNQAGKMIEIQGTAEGSPFHRNEMDQMLDLAAGGIGQLFQIQDQVLEKI